MLPNLINQKNVKFDATLVHLPSPLVSIASLVQKYEKQMCCSQNKSKGLSSPYSPHVHILPYSLHVSSNLKHKYCKYCGRCPLKHSANAASLRNICHMSRLCTEHVKLLSNDPSDIFIFIIPIIIH